MTTTRNHRLTTLAVIVYMIIGLMGISLFTVDVSYLKDIVLLDGEKPIMLMSNLGIMSVLLGIVGVMMFVLIGKIIISDRI
jgi:uncharacterized membrane protein YuzA (DUF378 family)